MSGINLKKLKVKLKHNIIESLMQKNSCVLFFFISEGNKNIKFGTKKILKTFFKYSTKNLERSLVKVQNSVLILGVEDTLSFIYHYFTQHTFGFCCLYYLNLCFKKLNATLYILLSDSQIFYTLNKIKMLSSSNG